MRNSGYRQLLTISVQLEKATENRGDKFALIVVTFEVLLKYLEVQRLIISVFLTVWRGILTEYYSSTLLKDVYDSNCLKKTAINNFQK